MLDFPSNSKVSVLESKPDKEGFSLYDNLIFSVSNSKEFYFLVILYSTFGKLRLITANVIRSSKN